MLPSPSLSKALKIFNPTLEMLPEQKANRCTESSAHNILAWRRARPYIRWISQGPNALRGPESGPLPETYLLECNLLLLGAFRLHHHSNWLAQQKHVKFVRNLPSICFVSQCICLESTMKITWLSFWIIFLTISGSFYRIHRSGQQTVSKKWMKSWVKRMILWWPNAMVVWLWVARSSNALRTLAN